jgi:hypothetical protein
MVSNNASCVPDIGDSSAYVRLVPLLLLPRECLSLVEAEQDNAAEAIGD